MGAVVGVLAACDGDPGGRVTHVATIARADSVATADVSPTVAHDVEKYGEGVEWAADLDEAMERGRARNKPVLVIFSALRQELCGGEHEY